MSLRDLELPDLLDVAQASIDRMRSDDYLEQLMGMSLFQQVRPVLAVRILGYEPATQARTDIGGTDG